MGRDASNLDVKIVAAMPVTVVSMVLANPWDVLKAHQCSSIPTPTLTVPGITQVRYQRKPDLPDWSIDPRMIRRVIQTEVRCIARSRRQAVHRPLLPRSSLACHHSSVFSPQGFWASMYAGFAPNLVRNMVVGSAELVGYFQSKQVLKTHVGMEVGPSPMHTLSPHRV